VFATGAAPAGCRTLPFGLTTGSWSSQPVFTCVFILVFAVLFVNGNRYTLLSLFLNFLLPACRPHRRTLWLDKHPWRRIS